MSEKTTGLSPDDLSRMPLRKPAVEPKLPCVSVRMVIPESSYARDLEAPLELLLGDIQAY